MNISRSSSKTRFDVVIVGGGHNGLTCACYLAKAGLSVGVFERRSILGGAAVTEEFHPGFRNSTASYTVSLLNPKVIRDLRLVEHGLKVLERPMQNFLPLPDGRALTAGPDSARTTASVAAFLDARRRAPARLLQDARRGGRTAAARNCWKHRPRIRAACATCGAPCSSAGTFRKLDAACSATSTSCSRAAPATC